MMMMAVIMEGLPAEGHSLSLPPSSVRFGPHGSDRLPSKWEKLTQELGLGAGEQLEGCVKGSVQLLAFVGTAPLSMKAQHEGALPPPCIVRKDPRVPHTARRGA